LVDFGGLIQVVLCINIPVKETIWEHLKDLLGALRTPFFCLLTHFLPLSDPFSTIFPPIFCRFPAHFLPFSDQFSAACRPFFYFLQDAFFGSRNFLITAPGAAAETQFPGTI
jgi:hypothetical protein